VEIVRFEASFHVKWLGSLCSRAELWSGEDGTPVVTDNDNYLARCWFENADSSGIVDPYKLARVLADQPGIVEHGLFLDMADKVIIAGSGEIQILDRSV
jgi:ribose 5-phosphate isomerase A